MPRPVDEKLRAALLRDIFWRSSSPVRSNAIRFGRSRQAVHKNLLRLIKDGLVEMDQSGKRRRYYLKFDTRQLKLNLDGSVGEDRVWGQLKDVIADLDRESSDICHYGLTEMTNNAIDHSGGKVARVAVARSAVSVRITVNDDGVGIFRKIAAALNLPDPRQSLLELSKGKFTTDPKRHTGEGIFFTSRVFERFTLRSSDLVFVHRIDSDDWLLEDREKVVAGTRVTMELIIPAGRTLNEITMAYSSGPDEYAFSKTHVPVSLARYGDDSLISRSAAKRVLLRFEKFKEVMLDFADVRNVGQGFADEIFRVFAAEHPEVRIVPINMNAAVTRIVERARSALRKQADGPTLFDDTP